MTSKILIPDNVSDIADQLFVFPMFAVQPALGTDWSFDLNGFNTFAGTQLETIQILEISALLTTSAVAGNRTAALRLQATNGFYWVGVARYNQPASTTARYTWTAGYMGDTSPGVAGNVIEARLPDPVVIAAGGDTLTSSTGGILAGDRWSIPVMRMAKLR